jgi:hypothetical protein
MKSTAIWSVRCYNKESMAAGGGEDEGFERRALYVEWSKNGGRERGNFFVF